LRTALKDAASSYRAEVAEGLFPTKDHSHE
jgi:ketopantoate hydroxymethyltransferase